LSHDDLLLLTGDEIVSLLEGREMEVIDAVEGAYRAHEIGQSDLPHSTFLKFPDNPANRIIGLPAYLGGEGEIAGFKWIASFPANISQGIPRASAVLVLNDCRTGRPTAILEGSIISAQRTAASAALAARVLGPKPTSVGLIGAGFIHQQTARFLQRVFPGIESFSVYDLDAKRAESFCSSIRERLGVEAEVARDLEEVLASGPVISFATTAGTPYLRDLSPCSPEATLLHISLRDLAPEAILAANNVVDDVDHVCRAGTSIHLTAEASGNRDFIWCSLAQLMAGLAPEETHPGGLRVFSPFGLGVLDLAVGRLVCSLARRQSIGRQVSHFFPH